MHQPYVCFVRWEAFQSNRLKLAQKLSATARKWCFAPISHNLTRALDKSRDPLGLRKIRTLERNICFGAYLRCWSHHPGTLLWVESWFGGLKSTIVVLCVFAILGAETISSLQVFKTHALTNFVILGRKMHQPYFCFVRWEAFQSNRLKLAQNLSTTARELAQNLSIKIDSNLTRALDKSRDSLGLRKIRIWGRNIRFGEYLRCWRHHLGTLLWAESWFGGLKSTIVVLCVFAILGAETISSLQVFEIHAFTNFVILDRKMHQPYFCFVRL